MHGHLQGRRPAERHLGGGRSSLEGLVSCRRVAASGSGSRRLWRSEWPCGRSRRCWWRRGRRASSTTRPTTARWPSWSRTARASCARRSSTATTCRCPTAERAPLFTTLVAGLYKLGLDGGDGRLIGLLTGGGTIARWACSGAGWRATAPGCWRPASRPLYPTLIAADGAMMTESTVRAVRGALAAGRLPAARRARPRPGGGARGARSGSRRTRAPRLCCCCRCCSCRVLRRPGGVKAAAAVCAAFARGAGALDGAQLVGLRPARADRHRGRRDARGRELPRHLLRRADRHLGGVVRRFSGRGNEAEELNEAGHDGIRYALRPRRPDPGGGGRAAGAHVGPVAAVRRARGPARVGAAPRRGALLRADPAGRLRLRAAAPPAGAGLDPDGAVHHGNGDRAAGLRPDPLPPLGRAVAGGAGGGGARPAAARGRRPPI